jgi:hypothetical protein
VASNRAVAYLYPTDVGDARALWVNPAGLGRHSEASLHWDITVGNPGSGGRLRQLTLGFNSRGLSLGYQRDVFDAGVRGHTYRLGLGAGHGGVAAGLAVAIYRGGTKGTGWDFGVVHEPNRRIALGASVGNVRQPVVRGTRQIATFIPGVTVKPFGTLFAFSALGHFTSDAVLGYSLGARLQAADPVPLGLLLRLDTDGGLRRAALVVGASFGGQDLVGAVASMLGKSDRLDPVEFYSVTSRSSAP